METKQTLLVIPYLPSSAQGGELETAVRGWKKNFKGNLHILIIGDSSSVVEKLIAEGSAEFYPLPRKVENVREPQLDVACKMVAVLCKYMGGIYTGCIWSNDDIYPVNKVSLSDIKRLKTLGDNLEGKADSANYFKRSMYRTREALIAAGKPIRNYCNHLPEWYDFKRLADVINEFDCANVPHVINSLYFNYWYPEGKTPRVDLSKEGNRYKLGVYEKTFDLDVLRKRIKEGVLFVNNSSAGYTTKLIMTIREFL